MTHFPSGGAGAQQRLVLRLLLFQGDAGRRQRQQRRAAARDQAEHQVIGPEALDHPKDAAGGVEARLVRHRNRRLHLLATAASNGIAAPGEQQALARRAVRVRQLASTSSAKRGVTYGYSPVLTP